MRSIASALLLLILPSVVSAQQDSEHPIDLRLDECIEEDPSTHGTVACMRTAYDEWDAELNRVYQQLLTELSHDDDATASLRSAQRAWIGFRDAELAFSAHLYGTRDGTMWQVVAAGARVDIVRQRALDLSDYLWALAPD
ncbi:MAG: lysozyme inhibitor LprI family protein [Rubricoccaceae bacterium]|nr:lysozyme inhibitor LprI family protein [Rubricoccaceae bacterium]